MEDALATDSKTRMLTLPPSILWSTVVQKAAVSNLKPTGGPWRSGCNNKVLLSGGHDQFTARVKWSGAR